MVKEISSSGQRDSSPKKGLDFLRLAQRTKQEKSPSGSSDGSDKGKESPSSLRRSSDFIRILAEQERMQEKGERIESKEVV